MYKLSDNEKKLIQIFKTFFQKSILPQLKKFDGSLTQWIKFSSLLIVDNINYNDLQLFVDTLPIWGNEKAPIYNRKSQVNSTGIDVQGFNPNKTFGVGQRSKMGAFVGEFENAKNTSREDSLKQKMAQNTNTILGNLQKLLKSMEQNQVAIDLLHKQQILPASNNIIKSAHQTTSPTIITQPNPQPNPPKHSLPYIPHPYNNQQAQHPLQPLNNSMPFLQMGNPNINMYNPNIGNYQKSFY